MRGLFGYALAALLASSVAAPLPVETQAEREHRNRTAGNRRERVQRSKRRNRLSAEHYAKHDPFYGIPTKGRRNAAGRAKLLEIQFKKSRVGKRNARGRDIGNPFSWQARNEAFHSFLAEGKSHNEALKLARRVPVQAKVVRIGRGRIVPAHASGPAPVPNPAHRSGGGVR